MTKIAFFDVDGTLVGDSSIPTQATIDAIYRFQADGNLAFICTGRSKPEILPEIMAIGFDGIIGAGGGYISYGDDILRHHTMPEKAVREIIAFFDAHDIGYYLESNSGLFGSKHYKANIQKTIQDYCQGDETKIEQIVTASQWFYDLIDSFARREINYSDVNKISFINQEVAYQTIVEKFGQQFEMFQMTVPFFGKESGEIAVKGNDKQTAIEIVLKKLGLTKADAISFGDANNDLAMFRACGYNIAMGNGTAELKAAADEVTLDVAHDGIAESFKKNNYFK
ncbi:Cof-type HAD-IIB family hydrolase [Pseudolactococcus yaeyamensis]